MDETSEGALGSQSGLETLLSQGETPPREQHEPLDDPSHIGRFVVLRRVGEGGMGIVFAAYDNELERRVALKLVRARAHGNTGARIKREAQALARLSHPNVVHVYEVGSFEDQIFVAMEYITGPTLAEWAKSLVPGPERWRQVLATYIQVGRGLAAAHVARIVHRDFKPANAIVGDDGRVRVLDFGIARAADPDASSYSGPLEPPEPSLSAPALEAHTLDETLASETSDPLSMPLTQTGALMGTPAYMSPEQFERRGVGPASDQFSFCIALWEALYGERPFAGGNPAALMIAVLNGQLRSPPSNTSVPGWVHQILLRGLATDPEARWPSMEVLLDALGRDPARRRRRRLRRAGVATLVTTLVAGSGWFATVQRQEALAAEEASAEAQRLEAEAAAREAEANAARDRALVEAQANAVHARDTARVLAASDFGDRPEIANALLGDVERNDDTKGWSAAALQALQTPAPQHVFTGHEGRVVFLDVAADSEWLTSSSFDGTARLWSRDGKTTIVLPHPDNVLSSAFDPKGERLVTACRDGVARIWSIADLVEGHARGETEPTPQHELRGHEDLLWSASWSWKGNYIISTSRDGTARVWAAPDFAEVRRVEVPGNVWYADISPDERWAAAGSSWGNCKVWSLTEPERSPIELQGHGTKSIGDLHFSPANRSLVTAATDGKIRVYRHDPFEGTSPAPDLILDHEHEVFRLRFSRDGLSLLSSSRDCRAKLWSFGEDGSLLGPPKILAENPANVVWSSDFSPDGRLAAIGLAGGTTEIWPLEGGPPLVLRGHISDVFRVRFAPDGRTLYTASNDGTVRAWDMDLNRVGRRLDGQRGPIHRIEAAGAMLASTALDGSLRLWSGFDPGTLPAVPGPPITIDGLGRAPTFAFGGSPHRFALADEDSPVIRIWALLGTLIRDLDQPLAELSLPNQKGVRALAFDPSAKLLAAASVDGHVYLWQLGQDPSTIAASEPIELAHHFLEQDSMTRLAFSPEGKTFVSAGGDRVVLAWSVADLAAAGPAAPPEPRVFRGHGSRVQDLAFTPDGLHVISASLDHTARVWNLESPQQPVHEFEHGDVASCAAVNPSGTLLAVGSTDTKTYLWSLERGESVRVYPGAAGGIREVAFSPEGDYLAAASADGHLRMYPVEGGPSFDFEAEGSLFGVQFVDQGRRVAVAGGADVVQLWYLGDLGREALQQRLIDSTQVCLGADMRMEFVGEPRERAEAKAEACRLR